MELGEYFELLKMGEWRRAELLRQKSIPPKLIKFVALDGNDSTDDEKKLASLENKELWFSHISTVNDPYEFKGMMLDKNKFREAGYSDEIIAQYEKIFLHEDLGITCMSSNDVSYLPMWAYYTNNHRGYCIEYDVIKKDCIHKVLYEPKRIPIASLLFQFKDALNKAVVAGDERTIETEFYARIFLQKLFIKSKSWKHESEYRIVYPIGTGKGENVDISKLGLKTSKIIAGINCSNDNLQKLNEISKKIGCGVAFRTRISETEYSLVEEKLPGNYQTNEKEIISCSYNEDAFE